MDRGKEDGKQAMQAHRSTLVLTGNPGAQQSGADGKAHYKKKKKGGGGGKLGSGKPYDECSEMEAVLVIPDVS